ncbi:hypothetical protein [Cupriavidus basilensis]|uniref:hypothetical protein n=1 Tax=Cupriavidus basilensis TaxID=68895 RepID=UPI0023E7F4F4|nr:hypothetical protein [Cupriavidus basilensis]MDF3881317.1 hypothetical protein [Cupriavidus basilensis]
MPLPLLDKPGQPHKNMGRIAHIARSLNVLGGPGAFDHPPAFRCVQGGRGLQRHLRGNAMRQWFVLLTLGLFMGTAHAGKCVSGNKTLYTDMACPPGWQGTALGGNLSRISPEPATEAANQQFLQKRQAEENEYQARIAREQAESVRTEVNQCHWLGNQIRQLDYDYSVRRNARLPEQEDYRRRYRALRDQQARLRC